jgi:hypothetical protein
MAMIDESQLAKSGPSIDVNSNPGRKTPLILEVRFSDSGIGNCQTVRTSITNAKCGQWGHERTCFDEAIFSFRELPKSDRRKSGVCSVRQYDLRLLAISLMQCQNEISIIDPPRGPDLIRVSTADPLSWIMKLCDFARLIIHRACVTPTMSKPDV